MNTIFNSLIDYLRKSPRPAQTAKDRLSVIVARERASTRNGGEDYLPRLQQDLLAVLAKYEKIDLENVSVKLDKSGEYDVLELNIVLPEEFGGGAITAGVRKPAVAS